MPASRDQGFLDALHHLQAQIVGRGALPFAGMEILGVEAQKAAVQGFDEDEGFEPFSNRYRKEGVTYIPPVFAYRRKYGNSITGGYVYRGDKRSSFYGVYICGDYTSHRIFGLKQQDRALRVVRQIGTAPQGIASFATDERGEIYLVGYEGMVYHLDLAGTRFDEESRITGLPTPAAAAGKLEPK